MSRLAWYSLASLAACSPADDTRAPNAEVSAPAAQEAGVPPRTAPAGDATPSRYTRLSACTLVRSNPEEGGFYEHVCTGEGGYRLRLTESDLRQNVVVLPPGGGEHSLELSALANGAFNSVGDTIEWRGQTAGGAFRPRALIVRHSVMEDPDPRVPERSYLVVARLDPQPCVVARIAPGPGQNARARAAADAPVPCLAR